MTYAGNRRIIDVDSHVIELPEFLHEAADPALRDLLPSMSEQGELPVSEEGLARGRELFARRQSDSDTMARFEESMMEVRANGWSRLGAFDPDERSHALDRMGFEQQWILPTFSFHQIAHVADPAVLAAGARTLNRAMSGFCERDQRMKAIGYVPLSLGPEEAGRIFDEGMAAGCFTFMVDTNEPDSAARSFTHPDFDSVWSRFEEARRPFVVHVAVNGHYQGVPGSFRNNGQPEIPFGGDAPSSPLGLLTIGKSAELFLSAMIFDGVFDRHPRLRGVSMEHGALWVPSWLRALEFTARTLRRVRPVKTPPSEIARERLRVAPFVGEPLDWIVENIGPEMLVFATDYTHPEGGTDPIAKFEASLGDCSPEILDAFYFRNISSLLEA